MGKYINKSLSLFLCMAILLCLCPLPARAQSVWPENISIQAEGGIVIDADTGTVLYGKNIHNTYFPASITKILTALIVIEQCDLNEMVTFSHNAVYNVEAGSSSAGLDEGDVLSVHDCLYALLLKSANEAGNALAEHVAGSTEAFADMMNQRAAALGCQDSHFANPSGLNDPEHYVSAYDMALIGQAAVHNDTFMEIDSSLYYDLPITKRNPEGARIYPGHKMIKKNLPEYYEGCLGGKTGYTSLAGNTLVTFATRNGMTLVSVVLNGHQTQYSDTKTMLDFGFRNFQTVSAADYDTSYPSVENDLTIGGLTTTELYGLQLDPNGKVTLPKSADFTSVESRLSYELTSEAPSDAIARIDYWWGERPIGMSYLKLRTLNMSPASSFSGLFDSANEQTPNVSEARALSLEESYSDKQSDAEALEPEARSSFSLRIPSYIWVGLGTMTALVLLACLCILVKKYLDKKEEEARMLRRQKRLARLEDVGISPVEFDLLLERRHSSYTTKRPPKRKSRRSSFRL